MDGSSEHQQPQRRDRRRFRQQLQHKLDFSLVVALVERVDDHDQCWLRHVQGAQRLARSEHQRPPLVAERQRDDIRILADGVADVRFEEAGPARQLHGNGGDEHARRLELAAAAREEEAGAQPAVVVAAAGDGARNGRLARARHAVQPVDALRRRAGASAAAVAIVLRAAGLAVRPGHDLAKHVGARVWHA